MPTAMKNRPSSRPLNGSICDSSSCRNSESASSTPARKAPRPIDRPPSCTSQAVPTTTSSDVAVNTSGIFVHATTRNSCRSTSRPAEHDQRDHAQRTSDRWPGAGIRAGVGGGPSSGMIASSGIAARSWNSRIGESQAAVAGLQFLALGQQLQANRGRGQGQAQADDQRRLPADAQAQRDRAQRQRTSASPAGRRCRTRCGASPTAAPATVPGRSRTAASPRRTRRSARTLSGSFTRRMPYGPITTPATR